MLKKAFNHQATRNESSSLSLISATEPYLSLTDLEPSDNQPGQSTGEDLTRWPQGQGYRIPMRTAILGCSMLQFRQKYLLLLSGSERLLLLQPQPVCLPLFLLWSLAPVPSLTTAASTIRPDHPLLTFWLLEQTAYLCRWLQQLRWRPLEWPSLMTELIQSLWSQAAQLNLDNASLHSQILSATVTIRV